MEAMAVVFPEANTVQFMPVNCPDPGRDGVVVRVTHSWISNGTEGSFLRGERIAGDTAYRPGDAIPFPIVAGYQKIGVVEWVGEGVEDLSVGETVFCTMGMVDGMFASRGGHVSPSVCQRGDIWKLPASPDPLAFSGLVLTQVGYNCGVRAPIEPGEGAVVIGDGMVGNWAAQTLAWRGAKVLTVGHHADRLARVGVGSVHNTADGDWCDAAREKLGVPIAVVVDTVGSVPAVKQSLTLLKRYGHIVSAGFYGADDLVSLQLFRIAERSLDSVSGWSKERMDATLGLVASGALETLPLITHRFPVSEADRAWELIRSKDDGVLGVVLDW